MAKCESCKKKSDKLYKWSNQDVCKECFKIKYTQRKKEYAKR